MKLKSKISFTIFLSLLTLGAFAMHKKKNDQKSKADSTHTNNKNSKKIQSILFRKSACFGKCPIYSLELFPDGKLIYEGKENVSKVGIYEKNIGAERTARLYEQFYEIKPDTLLGFYQLRVADLPGLHFAIQYPDSTKNIINADAGPIELKIWASDVNTIADIDGDGWKKMNVK
jgi:hypothetical protein